MAEYLYVFLACSVELTILQLSLSLSQCVSSHTLAKWPLFALAKNQRVPPQVMSHLMKADFSTSLQDKLI